MWSGAPYPLGIFLVSKEQAPYAGGALISLEILVAALLLSAAFNSISFSYPVDGAPVGAGSLWPCETCQLSYWKFP